MTIPAGRLRQLRNDLKLRSVLQDLKVPTKQREGYLRFLCPLCGEFNTAVNPTTNLGRCFRCERNYNPIDMTMLVTRSSFLECVDLLERNLEREHDA